MLTAEMRRAGWRTAHEVIYDEAIYDRARPAAVAASLPLRRVAVLDPGMARLMAAVLEVPADAPIVRILDRLTRRSAVARVGLTDREIRAFELRATSVSWNRIASAMGISKAAAREFVRRADAKIEIAKGLDKRQGALSHTPFTVTA